MFENETQKIFIKYTESVKFLKKLHALVEPYTYRGEKHDAVFYNTVPSVYSFSSLEYDMHCALSNILKRANITRLSHDSKILYRYGSDNISIKDHIKAINKIGIDDFYYNAFYYGVYNVFRGYDKQDLTLINNTYENKRAGSSEMYLILNCLFLLDNPEPITWEQKQAIEKALKDSNTFIFKGCKVTLYNNGRLIIKFSNSELFTRFKKKAEATIKAINKELEQEAKA